MGGLAYCRAPFIHRVPVCEFSPDGDRRMSDGFEPDDRGGSITGHNVRSLAISDSRLIIVGR